MDKIAIAVIGYNRVMALKNLLFSLSILEPLENEITLIISLEFNYLPEVRNVAERFQWKYGRKVIVYHKEKLGLRNHFLWIGDQTSEYDTVIFLEDDLFLSPFALKAIKQIADFYKDDSRVAAISLYAPMICEFNAHRFYPIEDGSDCFFFQHPYWGNVWQKQKWVDFRRWYTSYKRNDRLLPDFTRTWRDTSFKVAYIQYLIETGKYVVYSRCSLVDNMCFAGLHNKGDENDMTTFHVPFLMQEKSYKLKTFDDSVAIYDANFEIEDFAIAKMNSKLKSYRFDVDFMHTCSNHDSDYVLTRGKSRNPILSFSDRTRPYEIGVGLGLEGSEIVLTKRADLMGDRGRYKEWKHEFVRNNMSGNRYLLRCWFYSGVFLLQRILNKIIRKG